jgi:PAS domain S-box-containing protein
MADPAADEVLDALASVLEVFADSARRVEEVDERAEELRAGRHRGASYAELLTDPHARLVLETISELLAGLFEAGSRLRRTEARALYAEGLSMEKISLLLGVSRQRVSAIISSPLDQRRTPDSERRRPTSLPFTESEFHAVAESLPYLVWLAGADGATEYFNGRGTDYTGQPRDTNNDWNWVTLVHPDDQERARSGWQRATETGTEFDLDYRIRRFDGEYRWHRFQSIPMRDQRGAVVKWVGTAHDIEDQKCLEQKLRRADREATDALALLEAVYTVIPVGLGLVDQECRIIRMNQRLAAIVGSPLEDQLGRSLVELVPRWWPRLARAIEHVQATSEGVVNMPFNGPPRGEPTATRGWLVSCHAVPLAENAVGMAFVVADK